MTQFNAGVKKEMMLFSRTYRLFAVIIIFLALAVFDSAMAMIMKGFAVAYDGMLEELAKSSAEFSELSNSINMTVMMDAAFGINPEVSMGIVTFLNDFASTGLIILILLLITVAGGEQKKRATIIPGCAGLKTGNYLLPKFLIYPTIAFITSVAAVLVSYGVSLVLYSNNDLTFQRIMVCGIFTGIYMAYAVCVHLFIGISTSRPGISAAIVIVLFTLLDALLSLMSLADKFNPFALKHFALYSLYYDLGGEANAFNMTNVLVTLCIVAVMTIAMYFLTLFILNAKKADNSGNYTII